MNTKTVTSVFTGAQGSGKSSLVAKITNPDHDFYDNYKPTMGSNLTVIKPDANLTLHYWDLPGLSRLEEFTSACYRRAHYIVLTIDLSEAIEESAVNRRIKKIRKQNDDAIIVLAGTKQDCETKPRHYMDDNIQQFKCLKLQDSKIYSRRFVTSSNNGSDIEALGNLLKQNPALTSDWEKAFSDLDVAMKTLSASRQTYVQLLTEELVKVLNFKPEKKSLEKTADEKIQIINQLLNLMHKKIENIEHPALKAFGVIASIVVVAVAAAIMGCAIGYGLTWWTGPLGFFAAIAAGTTTAIATIAVAAAIGLGAGGMTGYHLFFKKSDTEAAHEALNTYGDKISDLVCRPFA